MIFLPYERFVIKTQLAPAIILRKLNDATETSSRWTFFWQEHKPYRGKITGNKFDISRWISYRNSFLPIIKGRVNPDIGGSIVFVTMSLHWFVTLFLCFWFGSVFFMGFRFITETVLALFQSNPSFSVSLIPCAMPLAFLLFGYFLTMGSFKIESIKARDFLMGLLEADEVIDLKLLETELNV